MLLRAITGYPAPGRARLKSASCGLPDIGVLSAAGTATTTVIGAGISVTTAVLTMDSGTSEWAIRVATGTEIASITTVPLIM